MGDYKRDNRSGGRRDFNSRGSDRPSMHQATCSNCGKACEVPFRPTGSKPVYCRDCFQNTGPDTNRFEGRRFERSGSEDRPMYDAVCANCGDNCKIPFQPREGRQVFCSRCFEKNEGTDTRNSDNSRFSAKGGDRNDNRNRTNDQPNYKIQFETLNAKMDKILTLLTPSVTVEPLPLDSELDEDIIEEIVEEVTEEKPKKEKAAAKKKTKAATPKKKLKESPTVS